MQCHWLSLVLGASGSGALRGNISLARKWLASIKAINYSRPALSPLDSTYLAQTTVNNKVGTIDEAALITGKENNGMCLLDGLAETTTGEVDLTTETLGVVVAEPVL